MNPRLSADAELGLWKGVWTHSFSLWLDLLTAGFRKSSPIAHILKDPGGSHKASYYWPCITSSSFYWSNLEETTWVKYTETWFPWFTHLWRVAPTSIMKTVWDVDGILSVSSGPSFRLHKDFFLPPLRFWLFAYNLEKWHWRIYLQGSSGETDIEKRLMDMGRREERVRCMERGMWKLTSPYVK